MRTVRSMVTLALLAGWGCGGGDTTQLPTEATVPGVYSLTIVNGLHLPFPYGFDTTGTRAIEISGGSITLGADHSFKDVLVTKTFSQIGVDTVANTYTQTGTYVLNGSIVQVTYPGLGVEAIAVTGNQLNRTNGGLVMTYQK